MVTLWYQARLRIFDISLVLHINALIYYDCSGLSSIKIITAGFVTEKAGV